MNIFSIILYFLAASVIILVSSFKITNNGRYLVQDDKKDMKVWIIVFIATVVTIYNYYCTATSTPIAERDGADRYNYYVEFLGRRKTSDGLTLIFQFVKNFTADFEVVLYFTSFVCCLLTFFAYRLVEEKSTAALVFLFFTDILFTMFVNLKQCYANALVTMALALSMGKHKPYKDLLSVLCLIFALQFHVVAIISLPIYLLVRFKGWQKNNLVVVCIVLSVLFLCMEPLSLYIAKLIRPIYPYGADKLLEYFSSDTVHVEEGSIFSFIKGIPFYSIAIVGCIKRKQLKNMYHNYDSYLLMAIIGALFYFSSIISYWLYRGTALLFLPISIFFGLLYKNMKSKERVIFSVFTILPHAIVFCRWLILMCVNYGSL